jgi:lipoprotein-anchoring transpeptidase ErfK/SrfK
VIRRAVLFIVLVVALAVPGVASANVPASYPAAGPVAVPSVAIRANPSTTSTKLLVLRDYRDDGLTQYVLAVSGRRVGFVAATHAKLTLKNTSELNAFVLTARKAGTAGNHITAEVIDGVTQDTLVLHSGATLLASIPYDEADLATLAATINGMALAVKATASTTGPLKPKLATHLAGGTAGKPGRVWLRVVIPARPLNRKGWIPASAANVKPTEKRIVVNRSTHWLQVYKGDKRVFRTRVATGRPDRRTPLGLFYVAAKYRPPFNALVTAYALELSAPAGLPDFALGGVIGIHGTPAVSTLGYNASNGCIRVSPSAALRLKQIIPHGTPVRVIN